MEKIEIREKCKQCGGTGLLFGDRDIQRGAAVVCDDCKGTGCYHFEYFYEKFTKRKLPGKGIKRVYPARVGIIIGSGEKVTLEDFGGIPVEEWNGGCVFPFGSEDRKHVCPKW